MKTAAFIVVTAIAQLLLAPSTAFGQDQEIVVVKKDAPAPFKGFLVPEARYTELLEAEIERDKLAVDLRMELKYVAKIEPFLLNKVKDAATVSFFDLPSTNRWFGFILGIVVTGGVIAGAVEIMDARARANP